MEILTNQKSLQYPKDNLLSYKVIIIQKETIRKVSDGYMYDAYKFNSLNEYNNWIAEEKKNSEIKKLEQDNKQLEDRLKVLEIIPNLPDRMVENEANIAVTNETLNDLLSEVMPILLEEIELIKNK